MAKADAIPTLVPYLEYCSSMSRGGLYTSVGVDSQLKRYPSHRSGTQGQLDSEIQQLIKEVQNLVVLSMFYLTRLRWVFAFSLSEHVLNNVFIQVIHGKSNLRFVG